MSDKFVELINGKLLGTWAYAFFDCSDPSITANNGDFEVVEFVRIN